MAPPAASIFFSVFLFISLFTVFFIFSWGHVLDHSSTSVIKRAESALTSAAPPRPRTAAPVWDSDDVYVQDAQAPPTLCAASLRNVTEPRFRESFLPNIRLFLRRDDVNASEWKRLSRFNNPFGFMNYTYHDVMPTLRLIPQTKEPLLPPGDVGAEGARGAGGGCVRCAVVATSGILYGSKMGDEIDAHQHVFRMNGAVTRGFEDDVGNRTSVYVHTCHSIIGSAHWLRKHGFTTAPGDQETRYVLLLEGMRDVKWLRALLTGAEIQSGPDRGLRPRTFYPRLFNQSRLYVLHQDFLRYIRNRFLRSRFLNSSRWNIYRPTTGAVTLFLALHSCDSVSAYGFITENHGQFSNYYTDRGARSKVIFFQNHDYELEMKTWKRFHDANVIKLYQRSDTETEGTRRNKDKQR